MISTHRRPPGRLFLYGQSIKRSACRKLMAHAEVWSAAPCLPVACDPGQYRHSLPNPGLPFPSCFKAQERRPQRLQLPRVALNRDDLDEQFGTQVECLKHL